MKRTKNILALLLSVVMILSLLPSFAVAEVLRIGGGPSAGGVDDDDDDPEYGFPYRYFWNGMDSTNNNVKLKVGDTVNFDADAGLSADNYVITTSNPNDVVSLTYYSSGIVEGLVANKVGTATLVATFEDEPGDVYSTHTFNITVVEEDETTTTGDVSVWPMVFDGVVIKDANTGNVLPQWSADRFGTSGYYVATMTVGDHLTIDFDYTEDELSGIEEITEAGYDAPTLSINSSFSEAGVVSISGYTITASKPGNALICAGVCGDFGYLAITVVAAPEIIDADDFEVDVEDDGTVTVWVDGIDEATVATSGVEVNASNVDVAAVVEALVKGSHINAGENTVYFTLDKQQTATVENTITYSVTPKLTVNGFTAVVNNDQLSGNVTFQLDVTDITTAAGDQVIAQHKSNGTVVDTKVYTAQADGGKRYIEITTGSFSDWDLTSVPSGSVAAIYRSGAYVSSHTTLAEAFAAAEDGDTITLLADTSVDNPITVGSITVELDLNGHVVTNNAGAQVRAFELSNNTNFTVTGTKAGSGMVNSAAVDGKTYGFFRIYQKTNATLTVNGGTYIGNTANGAFVRVSKNSSGSVVNLVNANVTTDWAIFDNTNGGAVALTMTGGTYTQNNVVNGQGNLDSSGKPVGAIHVVSHSTLNMTGVTLNSMGGTGVAVESQSEGTLKNCAITITGTENSWASCAVGIGGLSSVTLDGGTYTSGLHGVSYYTSGGELIVKGGAVIDGVADGIAYYYDTGYYSNLWKDDFPNGVPFYTTLIDGTIKNGLANYNGGGTNAAKNDSRLTVEGGEIDGDYTVDGTVDVYSITGGTFTGDPSQWVADGYGVTDNGDGTWTVIPYVAQIGGTKYTTLSAAILAAADGATIEILEGTWGEAAVGTLNTTQALSVRARSLTIQPASGANVTFTSNVYLGYDDSHTADASMTVTGLNFDHATLTLVNYAQATVENCSFTGSGENASAALYIGDSCVQNHVNDAVITTSQVTVQNCTVNGTEAGDPGIRLRNTGNVTLTGNTVLNAAHNGILFESNPSVDNTPVKTITITDNTITEWNAGNKKDGGRGIRLALGTLAAGSTVTINDNYFTKETLNLDAPDFAKITGASNATVNLSHNYWNNKSLSEVVNSNGAIYTSDGTVTIASVIQDVAQIGETKYESLAAAVAAVPANGTKTTITMLANSAETGVITVAAGKNVELDLNDKTVSYSADAVSNSVYFITNIGTLTVKDTSANADGMILFTAPTYDTGYAKENVTVYNLGGTLNLQSGTIKNATAGGLSYAVNNSSNAWGNSVVSTFNMTGGVVSAPHGDAALRVYQNTGISWKVYSTNHVNISGGTILDNGIFVDTTLYTKGQNAEGFTANNIANGCVIDTQINISGGTINGLIDMKIRHPFFTSLNITGGNFTNSKLWVRKVANEYGKNLTAGEIAEPSEPMVTISGGTWSFTNNKAFGLSYNCDATSWTSYEHPYLVSGGVFNVDLNNFTGVVFPEGKTGVANTDAETSESYPYTVGVETTYVAQIGDVQYASLEAALAAAVDGNTITLLADSTGAGLFIGENKFTTTGLTIDFNGKTYTVETPVGSSGTVNQALHFEEGNKITLTSSAQTNDTPTKGTINITTDTTKRAAFNMFMQNYGELTVEKMNLDGTGIAIATYSDPKYQAYPGWYNTEKPQFNYNTAGNSVIRNSTITMPGALGVDDAAALLIEDDAVINVSAIATKGTDDRYASAHSVVNVENGAKFTLSGDGAATAFETYLAAKGQSLGTAVNGVYTVEQVPVQAAATVIGAALMLEGTILVNFYMSIPEGSDANYVTLTINDRETKIAVADGIVDNAYPEYLRFDVTTYAKEMGDTIYLRVYDVHDNLLQINTNAAPTTLIDVYTYSVDTYLESAKEVDPNQYQNLPELAVAMMGYGDYAAWYFENRSGNSSLNNDAPEAPTNLDAYAPVPSDGVLGTTNILGGSLILEEAVTIRVYLSAYNADYTYTYSYIDKNNHNIEHPLDASNIDPAYELHYVEITDVAAQDLDIMYTFKISDGDNTYTYQYSALSYVRAVLNSTAVSQTLRDLVVMVYNYNQAANTYFDNRDKTN